MDFFLTLQSVGMRPLERSLEKLDDVRRKKLNDMIGCSENSQSGGGSSGLEFFFIYFSLSCIAL